MKSSSILILILITIILVCVSFLLLKRENSTEDLPNDETLQEKESSLSPQTLQENTHQNENDTPQENSLNESIANNPKEEPQIIEPGEEPEETSSFLEEIQKNPSKNTSFAHITKEHCFDSCEAFSGDFVYLEYCENVCNLNDPQDTQKEDCETKEGLPKDYCLKDLALTNLDLSICTSLSDTNLKESCTSRITEELLER